jgi:hypothetical protein
MLLSMIAAMAPEDFPFIPAQASATPSDNILNPLFTYPPFRTSGGASLHRQT